MSVKIINEKKPRFDNAQKKRVELHLQTNMSQMHAVTQINEYLERALDFGHKAIAVTDLASVQSYPEMFRAAGDAIKAIYGIEMKLQDSFADVCILVKNQTGLKNLYKLVSWAHLENLRDGMPCLTKEKISEYRDGLLVASGCEGELYGAVADGKAWDELSEIAKFYDYLEIQPTENGRTKEINEATVRLGEELNIPVCAVGNVHYCDPEDKIFRQILLNDDSIPEQYFRTTEEMLGEFSYLGRDRAYEVVVTNTNLIADMIEEVDLKLAEFGRPRLPEADSELTDCVRENAEKLYGSPVPDIIKSRMEAELKIITDNGYSTLYVIAKRLAEKSRQSGYRVCSRGSVGASLVAFFAGLTEINPLPPHYVCPKCRRIEFLSGEDCGSGFDLPTKICPDCNAKMKSDGHDIPFETFLGFCGDREPDIDLNFAPEYQQKAQLDLKEMFGDKKVFFAGAIQTLFSTKRVRRMINEYSQKCGCEFTEDEIRLICDKFSRVKTGENSHPGGLMIIPENCEAEDFTPLQYRFNEKQSGIVISQLGYFDIYDSVLKIDVLGLTALDMFKYLEDATGVNADSIDMNDPEVFSLLTSPKALGVSDSDILSSTGTLALPELGSPFIRRMLQKCKPKCFSQLVKMSGLSHGTDVWFDNAEDLLENRIAHISEVISTRDDIMNTLVYHGIERKTAFSIMETVRKGRGRAEISDEQVALMLSCGIPEWYIESMKKIRYLFPKAHAASYMMNAVRLGWYKIHYPAEFYAAYLNGFWEYFEGATVLEGSQAVRNKLISLMVSKDKDRTPFSETISVLHVTYEAMQRGIEFLPAEIGISQEERFTVEGGKLRIPIFADPFYDEDS